MDDFLRVVTSDFEHIANCTGFQFNQYSGSVNWENLEEFVIDDLVNKVDVKSLSMLVASVLSYNIDKMSASKKIFRLSQLIIDFLLHCKKHSTFMFNNKVDSMTLCKLCGKMFVDITYLKYHCFREHNLNSCNFISTLENENVTCLKSEIVHLKNQLIENSKMCLEEKKASNCYAVHKNKLLYHIVSQPGDNPMQTQEIYWKQKYDSLEKNYNILKNELDKHKTTIKTTPILHHKYQQYDFNENEKSSKYVVQNTSPICYPKRSCKKIDLTHKNYNTDICSLDNLNIDQLDSECIRWNGDGCSDKDFYELKKLRQEARMNIVENNMHEDYFEPLMSSDYVDSLKIILILGETRVNELFKNTSLMNSIKFDVKELVNKRLEECFKYTDKNIEQKNISNEKNICEDQETCSVSFTEDNNLQQFYSSKIDSNTISVKKNKTIISKFKKALGLKRVFSPDTTCKKN